MRAYIITPGYTGKRRYHGSPILRTDHMSDEDLQAESGECISWIDESLINPKFREKKEAARPVESVNTATGPEFREKLNEVFAEVAITKPDAPAVRMELTRENLEAGIKEGLTNQQLGERFGLHKSTIGYHKNKWGLLSQDLWGRRVTAPQGAQIEALRQSHEPTVEQVPTETKSRPSKKHDLTKESLRTMIDRGMSYSQIAKSRGLHQSTIGYLCKKWGLQPARSGYRHLPPDVVDKTWALPKDAEFVAPEYVEPPMPSHEDVLIKRMQALVAGYTAELAQIIEQQKEMAKRAEILSKKRDALDAALAAFEEVAS